jgi:hypothetical protein
MTFNFDSKEESQDWAEDLSKAGERDVHIQDASEFDSDRIIDGYLVGN